MQLLVTELMTDDNIKQFVFPDVASKALDEPYCILIVGFHYVRFDQFKYSQSHSEKHYFSVVYELVPKFDSSFKTKVAAENCIKPLN